MLVQLDPPAVEFDLVQPLLTVRWGGAQLAGSVAKLVDSESCGAWRARTNVQPLRMVSVFLTANYQGLP